MESLPCIQPEARAACNLPWASERGLTRIANRACAYAPTSVDFRASEPLPGTAPFPPNILLFQRTNVVTHFTLSPPYSCLISCKLQLALRKGKGNGVTGKEERERIVGKRDINLALPHHIISTIWGNISPSILSLHIHMHMHMQCTLPKTNTPHLPTHCTTFIAYKCKWQ